jgi:large subunit ribosomal protein L7/L12
MAELIQQQVIDYIKGISVLELSQLVKTLESELGVSAAAAMPMAMRGAGGGGRAAARREEKTEFTVSLVSFRPTRINIIKVGARSHEPRIERSQGPRGSRAQVLKEGVPRKKRKPSKEVRRVGAKVEIK